jgi:hypothetical protein
MSSAYVWLRNLSPFALALCVFSCAHAPDPHVHLSAPAPPFDKRLIVRGNVVDATTGEPIPYADVYVIDARHENWEALKGYSARLGTTDRDGVVDLAVTSIASDDVVSSSGFRSGFRRWAETKSIVEAAEARCREGKPPTTVVVLTVSSHNDAILFPETPLQFDESRGAHILELGTATMVRRPDSDFISAESWLESQEAEAK